MKTRNKLFQSAAICSLAVFFSFPINIFFSKKTAKPGAGIFVLRADPGSKEKISAGAHDSFSELKAGLLKRYAPDDRELKKISDWQKRFLKGDGNLLVNFSLADFHLFRYHDLQRDFLKQNWEKGISSLLNGILLGKDTEMRIRIVLFLERKRAGKYNDYYQKSLEALSRGKLDPAKQRLKSVLAWAVAGGEKMTFLQSLKEKDSQVLKNISFEDFNRKNGNLYPTALQLLNFDSLHALLTGLQNPDHRLRLYYLKVLKNIKTPYNQRFILERITLLEKIEIHGEVRDYLLKLIEYMKLW
jgi:hypothetical protein